MSDTKQLPALPSAERIQQELASATSVDDFFGKDGIFARLFATTIEQMLEAELTAHLGYERYAAEGTTLATVAMASVSGNYEPPPAMWRCRFPVIALARFILPS